MDDSWLRFIMFIDVICCNSGPPQAFASSIRPTCESRYSSAGQGFSWKNASIASVSDHAGRLITCPTLHSNETQTGMIMMTSKILKPWHNANSRIKKQTIINHFNTISMKCKTKTSSSHTNSNSHSKGRSLGTCAHHGNLSGAIPLLQKPGVRWPQVA